MNNIDKLREQMKRHNIDFYIVPTCDFNGSEYIDDYFKSREYLTGFTGSAGEVLVTKTDAYLFTDSRYFIQAKLELEGSGIILMKEGVEGVPSIFDFIEELTGDALSTLGFDGRVMKLKDALRYRKIRNVSIKDIDLITPIWDERPKMTCNDIVCLDASQEDESYAYRLQKCRDYLREKGADSVIITATDDIAYLTCHRGSDVKYCPVFLSFMYVNLNEAMLFVKRENDTRDFQSFKELGITVKGYEEFFEYIKTIKGKSILLSPDKTSFSIYKSLAYENEIIEGMLPTTLMKMVKTGLEQKNMRLAHIEDAISFTKFIYGLKRKAQDAGCGNEIGLSESDVASYLEEFKRKSSYNIEPSFETIAGYNENGAIVHYSAKPGEDLKVKAEGVILIDAGTQYSIGTTDITRTISLGKVTDKMRKVYTSVLKGHLDVAGVIFKKGTTGVSLDLMAKEPIWKAGYDYGHGTGHGVGYMLNVHEGPVGIRSKIPKDESQNPPFEEGMITSDEPGVYIEGEFGVRIENLLLCKKYDEDMLCFENLTLVPYDKNLIDTDMLTAGEKEYLEKYNKRVYDTISERLCADERKWLLSELSI